MCRVLLIWVPLLLPSAALAEVDFDRDIAGLLARRCLNCHSGSAPKGKLDLSVHKGARRVVVPGKPEESDLWQRVRDDEMPPKKPLPAVEKELLKRWIALGAKWGTDPIDPFRVSTAKRAGYDWWSLRPVVRPTPPAVKNLNWPHNPIDHFLLARLEAKGIAPSSAADRRTLIRRLSFDLLGLPPTPEEVEAFLQDDRPDAYERLVDRLLSSPHHGERWARHWLDIVRFGESDGFERDLPRPNAWPYRDWVVRAFNADLPYDEFTRLQLAGDVLHPTDPDALTATGFLVAGPHDIVVPVSATMKASMRQDEMEDIVGTVGQTFLGLTVHCARCHDHKFDPVPQRDYYRLVAALAGVGFGERPFVDPQDRKRADQLRQRLARVNRDIAAIEEPIRRLILAEKRNPNAPARDRDSRVRPLAEWDFAEGLSDRFGQLHGTAIGGARQDAAGLHVDGRKTFVRTAPLRDDLTAKTLEAWVRLDNLTQRGGGVISVQTTDGQVFDAIVFGEQEPGRWMSGSDFFRRTRSFAGPAETEAAKRIVHVAITYHSDGTITAYRDGVVYGKAYRSEGPIRFRAGKAEVVFGLRHGAPGGNRMLKGIIRRARLYDRALTAEEVAESAGILTVRPEEIVDRIAPAQRERHRQLRAERRDLMKDQRLIEQRLARKVYAVNSTQPDPTHLLIRGNVTTPSERVTPERLTALSAHLPATGLKADAPEGDRRVALARWISDPRNPLFARVIVNRLWQYHFGIGLVDTPSDLGFNGGRPSHPELLDWLADELVRQKWSLKAMHRLIVTSAAYRQSSRPRPEALRVDADNRLVWRRSPMRLEAEAVRDAMLAVSGELDSRMGGPPYQDFRSYFFKGTQFYDPVEQVGPAFNRRSLYRMWARGGRNPFLDTFDCPDPSATTPRRAVTTTPLQSLALFNNAFVLHQAEQLARRVRAEVGANADRQIERVYMLAHGRTIEPRERELVGPFVERYGLEALCRVVFNTSEFVQVE